MPLKPARFRLPARTSRRAGLRVGPAGTAYWGRHGRVAAMAHARRERIVVVLALLVCCTGLLVALPGLTAGSGGRPASEIADAAGGLSLLPPASGAEPIAPSTGAATPAPTSTPKLTPTASGGPSGASAVRPAPRPAGTAVPVSTTTGSATPASGGSTAAKAPNPKATANRGKKPTKPPKPPKPRG